MAFLTATNTKSTHFYVAPFLTLGVFCEKTTLPFCPFRLPLARAALFVARARDRARGTRTRRLNSDCEAVASGLSLNLNIFLRSGVQLVPPPQSISSSTRGADPRCSIPRVLL